MANPITTPLVRAQGREIRIPVPFGHIAGLEYGPTDGIPVLALHGWQDNAKTFEPLIPFLPPNLHIIAIDFPGHGFSSHAGFGAGNYSRLSYAISILQVVKYIKWKKFSILAHSIGAMISVSFTAWYPEMVENLITLDVLYPMGTNLINPKEMPSILLRLLELEEREFSKQRECTWDEALYQFAGPRPLSEENAKLLLSRSLRPGSKEGYYIFTRDNRVNMIDTPTYNNSAVEVFMEWFKRYTGTWLAIIQKNNHITPIVVRDEGTIEQYTKSCKLFRVVHVNEGHYMHMENPKLIASYICEIFNMNPKL